MRQGSLSMMMRPGRRKLLREYEEGRAPSDFLYGYTELKKTFPGLTLDEFDIANTNSQWLLVSKFLKRFDRWLSKYLLFNLKTEIALQHLELLRNREIVITNIDSIGLSLALMRYLFPNRAKQLHISQGLTNDLDGSNGRQPFFQAIRKQLTALVIEQIDHSVVLGKGAKESLQKEHLCRAGKVNVVQFGVDADYWNRSKSDSSDSFEADSDAYILSVGSDAGRDYQTLLKTTLSCKLKIVTRHQLENNNAQVELISDISDAELRTLYQHARMLVIALHDIPQPTGQSAALQSMACGTPVVISNTRGFWDPVHLQHGRDLVFVPFGNSAALQSTIENTLQDATQLRGMAERSRQTVENRYTVKHFASKLASLCFQLRMNTWSQAV